MSEDSHRTDGGSDEVVLDPWGSSTVADYRELFTEFGIESFDEVLDSVDHPHYLMRRGVIFGHRGYGRITRAMRNGDPFAALSGFMPTGDPHIGHKLVFDELIWHQRRGADTYGLIADLEAHSARGKTWDEVDTHARDYIVSLLACGFDPEAGTLYRQSTNREVQDLGFELGASARFTELQSIYGFDGETDVSHMQSVVTQMADILYPQRERPVPTVIPVGPDQDPHVRLARDLADRMRMFVVTEAFASFEVTEAERTLLRRIYEDVRTIVPDGDVRGADAAAYISGGPEAVDPDDRTVADDLSGPLDTTEAQLREKLANAELEPLRPRTRFFDRRATDEAFEGLIEAIEGEKRVYEGHVDAFDLDPGAADELARTVELENGGYGFIPPSSIYHRFMTGLTGGKMSSSLPASHISLLDDPEEGYEKVNAATTGGRETADLQRELGGRADECPVYELYAYLLADDDDEFAKRVYDECVGGERLCGDCKEQAATLMREFLAEHADRRAEVEERLDEIPFSFESDR